MLDIKILILEVVSTLIVSVLFVFLWRTGHRQEMPRQGGWWFVVAGFGLLLLGMVLSITANFPSLNRFVLIGQTPVAYFMQYFPGYLFGYFFLTVGLLKWIPAMVNLRQTERALVESEQRFNSIASQAPDAIVLTDEGGMISFWNPAAQKMFGYTGSEILGREIDAILLALPVGHPLRSAGSLTGPEPEPEIFRELTARRKDGTNFPVELSVAFLRLGDRRHAAGFMRDVGERERLQTQLAQAQKMELVGRLAAGVAHDFNNILSAIMGYSELLRMKMDSADPRCKYVDHILGASRRGGNLSQRLLSLSRQQMIEKQKIDICHVLTRLELLLVRILGEDIEVRMKLPEGGLPILADEAQIEQVFINLATNARDAMPKGGILAIQAEKVSVSGKKTGKGEPEQNRDYALITVGDNGTGMDEATLAHIYEPFFTTKETGKGTGLGLAIVYTVLQHHGGKIEVESQLGRGSTFRVHIPLVTGEEQRPLAQLLATPPGGSETILVAEDDQTVRNLIRTVLDDAGYRVLEAMNGQEALSQYKNHRDQVALLLTDVIMPKKDGRQVYDEISAFNPGIKVIFVSGYSGEILHLRGISEGKYHFIPKPLSPISILRTVREVLDE